MFVRNMLNYDRDAASEAVGLSCPGPSMTQQSFKEECDINTIVKRFGVTGQLPAPVAMPSYSDFSEVVDYQTALNAIRRSGEAFMGLPSGVRERFQNDPQQLLVFLGDEANRPEAEKLGLVSPKPPGDPAVSGSSS